MIVLGVIGATVLLWLYWLVAPAPRRWRKIRQARRILEDGDWNSALEMCKQLKQRGLSKWWETKVHEVMSRGYEAVGAECLANKEFERALESFEQAGELVGKDATEGRSEVLNGMLKEVRRQFALSVHSTTEAVHDIIGRTLMIQSPCPEASFWQALCYIRDGRKDLATSHFTELTSLDKDEESAYGSSLGQSTNIDPPLYLGSLLLEEGQNKEALRYLGAANRVDSNCPVVICLLGVAMLRSGGDLKFATKTLQRALGSRGFEIWEESPEQVWVEGFPVNTSYVRQCAIEFSYTCPLWGPDYRALARVGNSALAESYYRTGDYQAAADLFDRVSHQGAPSLEVLRGLGLSLVKLGQFDAAFKHLLAANELAHEEDPVTAGYLALCAAKGTPPSPEDKANNVKWAIWLLQKFERLGDAEWVELASEIHAEGRACEVEITPDQQLHLCNHLLSISDISPKAADAYNHLFGTASEALRQEFAWLYCRASQIHDVEHEHAVSLFAKTFEDEGAAKKFFAHHGWDFDELEFTFLRRAASQSPGQFPVVFGPDYPPRGEQLLMERIDRMLGGDDLDGAAAAADVFAKLAPRNTKALDCLSRLRHRQGKESEAIEFLDQWRQVEPNSDVPLVRLAVLQFRSGKNLEGLNTVRGALNLSKGQRRSSIGLLGARSLLANVLADTDKDGQHAPSHNGVSGGVNFLREALQLLQDALGHDPENHTARWCEVAVLYLLGEHEPLAGCGAAMKREDVSDAHFHYFAGLAHLFAGDHQAVADSTHRARFVANLAPECDYLLGWSAIEQNDSNEAARHLSEAIRRGPTPSQDFARALLGGIEFFRGDYKEAIENWNGVSGESLALWELQQPLANAVYLSAIRAYHEGNYQYAAQKVREAGKLGVRDRRLGALLAMSLLKAGQQLLYEA